MIGKEKKKINGASSQNQWHWKIYSKPNAKKTLKNLLVIFAFRVSI